MKNAFRTAPEIYKYLAIFFVVGFFAWMGIGNYEIWIKYWRSNWFQYLGIWTIYCVIYLLVISLCYWGISITIILIYHKLIKRSGKNPPLDSHLNHKPGY